MQSGLCAIVVMVMSPLNPSGEKGGRKRMDIALADSSLMACAGLLPREKNIKNSIYVGHRAGRIPAKEKNMKTYEELLELPDFFGPTPEQRSELAKARTRPYDELDHSVITASRGEVDPRFLVNPVEMPNSIPSAGFHMDFLIRRRRNPLADMTGAEQILYNDIVEYNRSKANNLDVGLDRAEERLILHESFESSALPNADRRSGAISLNLLDFSSSFRAAIRKAIE